MGDSGRSVALLRLASFLLFTAVWAQGQAPVPAVYQFVAGSTPPANAVTAPYPPYLPACRAVDPRYPERAPDGTQTYWMGTWTGTACSVSHPGSGFFNESNNVEFLTVVSGSQSWVAGTGKVQISDIGTIPGNSVYYESSVICSEGGQIGGGSQGHCYTYANPGGNSFITTVLVGTLSTRTLKKVSTDQTVAFSDIGNGLGACTTEDCYQFPVEVELLDGLGNPVSGATVAMFASAPPGSVRNYVGFTNCQLIGPDGSGNVLTDASGRASALLVWSNEPGTCSVTAVNAATAATPESNRLLFQFRISGYAPPTLLKFTADQSLSTSAALAGPGNCGTNCYQFPPIRIQELSIGGTPLGGDSVSFYVLRSASGNDMNCDIGPDRQGTLDSNGQGTLAGVRQTGLGTCTYFVSAGHGGSAAFQFSLTADPPPPPETPGVYLWAAGTSAPANVVTTPDGGQAVCKANDQYGITIVGYFNGSGCFGNAFSDVQRYATTDLQFLIVYSGKQVWVQGQNGTTYVPPANTINAGRGVYSDLLICSAGGAVGFVDRGGCTGPVPVALGSAKLLIGASSNRTLTKVSGDATTTTAAGIHGKGACLLPSLDPDCYQYDPLVIKFTDASGNPLAGLPVAFSAAASDGSVACQISATDPNNPTGPVNSLTVLTDAGGLATAKALGGFGIKLTGGPGTCNITATSPTAYNVPVFGVSLTLQGAATLSRISSDQTVTDFSALSGPGTCIPGPCYQFPPLVARLTDLAGNGILGASVTFTATPSTPKINCLMAGSENSLTVTTGQGGLATANAQGGFSVKMYGGLGTCTVTVSSPATLLDKAPANISFAMNIVSAPTTGVLSLEAVSGGNQTIAMDPSGLSVYTVTVLVKDSNGIPAANKDLSYSCNAVTGFYRTTSICLRTVNDQPVRSGADGTATASFVVQDSPGIFLITIGDITSKQYANTVSFTETVGSGDAVAGITLTMVPAVPVVNPIYWNQGFVALYAPVTVQATLPSGYPAGAGIPVNFTCGDRCLPNGDLDKYGPTTGSVVVLTDKNGRATLPAAFQWVGGKFFGIQTSNYHATPGAWSFLPTDTYLHNKFGLPYLNSASQTGDFPRSYPLVATNYYTRGTAGITLTDPGGPLSGQGSAATGCYRTIVNNSWFDWRSDALGVTIPPKGSATIDWYKLYNVETDTQFNKDNLFDWAGQGLGGAQLDLSVLGGPIYSAAYTGETADPTGKVRTSALAYGIGTYVINTAINKAADAELGPVLGWVVGKVLGKIEDFIEDAIADAYLPRLECAALQHDGDTPHMDLNVPNWGDITIRTQDAGFGGTAPAVKTIIISGDAQTKSRFSGAQTSAAVAAAFYQPLKVQFVDWNNAPVPGLAITWKCVTPGTIQCAIDPSGAATATTTTGADGIAVLNLLSSTRSPFVNGSSAAIWGSDGKFNVTASYNNLTATFQLTEDPASSGQPIPETVYLITNKTPAAKGEPVTFSVGVGPNFNFAFAPGLQITLFNGTQVIGGPYSTRVGVAFLTIDSLPEGTNKITAAFHDLDGKFADASATILQRVDSPTVHDPNSNLYCNNGGLSTSGPGTPYAYPSYIYLPGFGSVLERLTLSLKGLTADSPNGMSFLLAAPGGENLVFWSGSGGLSKATNLDITLDDSATQTLNSSGVAAGSYRPTAATFASLPGPATIAPEYAAPRGATTLNSAFAGSDTTGPTRWSLYMLGGTGATSISGWCMNVTPTPKAPTTTTLTALPASPAPVGTSVTFTARVDEPGSTSALPGTVTFKQGSTVLAGPMPLTSGGLAQFTITPAEGSTEITAVYSGLPGSAGNAGIAGSSSKLLYTVDTPTSRTNTNGRGVYCNTAPLRLPGTPGAASPYASRVFVSNAPTSLLRASVTLNGITLAAGDSPQMLLVPPNGGAFSFFSHAGAVFTTNSAMTFSDAAPDQGKTLLPGVVGSGVYLPIGGASADAYLYPAPSGPYGYPPLAGTATFIGTLGGTDPNDYWSLYAAQNGTAGSSGGSVAGGWCLNLAWLADPAVTVESSLNPSLYLQSVDLTAKVKGVNGITPTGTVTFLDGGNSIGQLTLAPGADLTATARLTVPAFIIGTHTITVAYSGDPEYKATTSDTLNQIIPVLTPVVTLTSSPNPAVAGGPITFTATVSGTGPAPGGTVKFSSGKSTLGSPTITTGTATQTALLEPGNSGQTFTAEYQGDSNYAPVTSSGVTQTVTQANSSVAVAASSNPATAGASVTYTATIRPVAPSALLPTGKVTFFDGSNQLGTAPIDTFGQAAYSTPAIVPGAHTITATYPGDTRLIGSTGILQLTTSLIASTTTLVMPASPSPPGQPIVLKTIVTTAGGPVSIGSVLYFADGAIIGAASVDATGVATFTMTGFGANAHTFSAYYLGTISIGGSPSSAITLTVTGVSQTITFAPLPDVGSGAIPFLIRASATSGLPVYFTSTTPAVCSVSGATVTVLSAGSCSIQAVQPGNSAYSTAPPVSRSFQVTPRSGQTISFAPLPNRTFGAAPITLAATSSSGLVVLFTSATPSTCQVNGATVLLLVPGGKCTIEAGQPGDSAFSPATSVNRSFAVLSGNGSGGFSSANFLPTGRISGSSNVAVGDFNGDNNPDIVLVDGSGLGMLLPGDGSGGFGAGITFATPSGALAVGDFNGDGKSDLAVTNYGSKTVSVLLAGGSAGFVPAVAFATGVKPYSVAAADFNGDGILDLAVANSGSNDISVLAGDGTGGFGAPVNFPVASAAQMSQALNNAPVAMTIGDFNGDGALDIAVGNAGTGTVNILPGNGMGSFGAAISLDAGAPPGGLGLMTSLTTGDFDGNGRLDFVVGRYDKNINLLLADGAGGYVSPGLNGAASSFSTNGYYTPAVGDFNGDGKLDLALPFAVALLGGGTGGFTTSPTFTAGVLPSQIATADFDRDGRPDLIVTLGGGDYGHFASILFGAPGATTLSLTTPASNVAFGATVPLTATINQAAFNSNPPAGTVTFFDATANIGTVAAPPYTLSISTLTAGSHSLKAVYAGAGGNAGSTSNTLTVAVTASSQTISFGALSDRAFGAAPFTVSATSSVGLTVAFTSATSAVCTVKGATVTLVSVGVCTIRASQSGNAYSPAAPNVDQSFNISATSQTIAFGALSDKIFGTVFTVGATSSVGLPVGFASLTSSVCTVSGTTVTTEAVGTCTIQASQPGNSYSPPAPSQSQSFTVNPVGQTITFAALPDKALGSAPFTVSASASSGLAVVFDSMTPVTCLVSGTIVTLVEPGICTIRASQQGNATTAGAVPVQRSFRITTATEGTFVADPNGPLSIGSFSGPTFIGTTDFNGDGIPDLAVTAGSQNYVRVLGSDGEGGFFSLNNLISTGSTPVFLAFGDFNKDGHRDAVVANRGGQGVTVLLGDGSGGFTKSTVGGIGPNATYTTAVAAGDFNQDGNPDLAITNNDIGHNTYTVFVLLGNGAGGFAASSSGPYGLRGSPTAIAIADFNGDGNPDLAVTNSTGVVVLLGSSTGVFSQSADIPLPPNDNPTSVVARDFNGDGKPDLAVASGRGVTVLAGNGTGSFAEVTGSPFAAGSFPTSIGSGDFNGDGSVDLAVTNRNDNNITVLIGNGAGSFAPGLGSPFPAGSAPTSVAVADFNRDGRLDLAVSNQGDNSVTVLLGSSAVPGAVLTTTSVAVIAGSVTPLTLTVTPTGFAPASGKVQFYEGATLLGSAAQATSPYSIIVSPTATGTHTYTATYTTDGGNDGFTSNAATILVVAGSAPTISFGPLTDVNYGTLPFALSASASSGLPVSFASNTSAVCTVSGTTLTLVSPGNCSITATQPGDTTHPVAIPNVQAFTVNKGVQTIAFPQLSTQTLGTTPVLIATATSGLAVSFTSNSASVCTVSEIALSLLAAGTCSITASQPGDPLWAAASPVTQTLTVAKVAQTIDFAQPSDTAVGAAAGGLNATSTSGLNVSFTSNTTAVCTVSGANATAVAAGQCSISASQAGDATYGAAASVTKTFNVTGANVITFPQPADILLSAGPVALTATASSALPVAFTSNTASVCTASGSSVTLVSVGTCSITATQPGNETFGPAPPMTKTFSVTKGNQTVAFNGVSNQALGTSPAILNVTASSGLTAAVSSTTTNVCTVTGSVLTVLATGTCTLQATQAGDANYFAASATKSLLVVQTLSMLAVGSNAGVSSVLVPMNGPWTAVSNSDFLHLDFGSAAGVGSAPVVFSYDAFGGTGVRSGTLTIAGLTVTVTQTGNDYLPAVGSFNLVTSGLSQPILQMRDAAGNLYIADNGNNAVKVWNAATGEVSTLIATGLSHPNLIAPAGGGNLYIRDNSSTGVLLWNSSTQQLTPLPNTTPGYPGMVADSAGNLYFTRSDTFPNYSVGFWNAATQQSTTLLSGLSRLGSITLDLAGNLYFISGNTVMKWTASTQEVSTLVASGLSSPNRVTVDPMGNVYISDVGSTSFRKWSAATQQVTTLLTLSAGSPFGVLADDSGSFFYSAATQNDGSLVVLPAALIPTATVSESAPAGSGSVSVVPSSTPLSGVLTPTSDSAWLTAGATTNGTVNFSFAANPTTTARTANMTVLGVPMAVTQAGLQSQTIIFDSLDTQTMGSTVPLSASASSGLQVSFTSTSTSVCTVAAAAVTLVGAGTCTIQASQAGNTAYTPAPSVSQSFTVLASQTITFASPGTQVFGANVTLSATATSGLPVSLTSNNSSVCTLSGTAVTILTVGSCSITATQSGSANYGAATSVTQAFQIIKATQTIDFGSMNLTVGSPFVVSITTSSGLPISSVYSNNDSQCEISGLTLVPKNVGGCQLVAEQYGNANYADVKSFSPLYVIGQGGQTITFGPLSNIAIGSTPPQLSATASSGMTVTFTSGTPQVCTVSGVVITLVSPGTCTILANQAGNSNYAPATVSQSFTVLGGATAQTITFAALVDRLIGDAVAPLSATASSGLVVTFTSTTPSVCTVSGVAVALVTTGSCSIQATQSGNGTYAPAPAVTRTFAVTSSAPISQTITFATPANRVLGSTGPALSATSSSNLPVRFASVAPSVCQVTGTQVTLLNTGVCAVRATQAGNVSYLAAKPVVRSFGISAALSGKFSSSILSLAPTGASAIATGDFNGDGKVDVVISSPSAKNAAIYLGDGSGGFTQASGSPYSTGYDPESVAVGDFNRDGNADIAVLNSGELSVTILMGNGLGGFSPAPNNPFILYGEDVLHSLTVGDFNGDGYDDLAVAATEFGYDFMGGRDPSSANYVVYRYLSNGDGTFGGKSRILLGDAFTIPYQPGLFSLVAGDLNGDGNLDLTGLPAATGSFYSILGDGNGNFSGPPGPGPAVASPNGISAADLNGDGVLDVVTSSGAGNSVLPAPGDGAGNFSSGPSFAVGAGPNAVLAGDFNGDGNADILTLGTSSATMLVGAGAGGFSAPAGGSFASGAVLFQGVTGDFNGDGRLDVIALNSDNNVTLFLGASTAPTSSLTTTVGTSVSASNPVPLILTIAPGGFAPNPAGTVKFYDGNALIGSAIQTSSPYTINATGLSTGIHSFTAVYSGDGASNGFTSSALTVTVVALQPQTITFGTLNDQKLNASVPALSATASSGLTVAFTSNSAAVCTVSGTAVTLVAIGTCSITASQAGNGTYAAASSVTRTLVVSAALISQTISFTQPADTALVAGPVALTATASSGLPVSFASNTMAVCTVSSASVTLVAVGQCSITASQAGDSNYNAATTVTKTFAVTTNTNTITFPQPADTALTAGPVALTATATSGLTVGYTSNTSSVCTVAASSVTLISAGTCSITANQAGNGSFAAAASVTKTFSVLKGAQTISFTQPPDTALAAGPVALTATASSGLSVSFVSNTTAVCTVSAASVTLVAVGQCSITASQAGDANYNAATTVTKTFAVTQPASPTVTLAVGDGSGFNGDSVEIPIQLTSVGTPALSTFQLDLNFDQVKLTYKSARIGAQLTAAGKSISTSVQPNGDVRLVAAGFNQNVIGNGTVAYVSFALSSPFSTSTVTPKGCNSADGQGIALGTACTVGTIRLPACDINSDGTANVSDVQLIINEALGVIPAVHDLNHDGSVNVSEVQKVINAALGLGCTLP